MKRLVIVLGVLITVFGYVHGQCSNVQQFVEKVRNGDWRAYIPLAECYVDGNGVIQSDFNGLCMYALFVERNVNDSLSLDCLEKNHLGTWIKNISQQVRSYSYEDLEKILMGRKDSDLLEALQFIYYEEKGDREGYKSFLESNVERFPALYNRLGLLYLKQASGNIVDKDILLAIECFQKADSYGMLSKHSATTLYNLYDEYAKEGIPKCDGKEMERLKLFIDR